MSSCSLRLADQAATEALAGAVADRLLPGDLLVLEGDLGAGKTCFVRAACRRLGVPRDVPIQSPTFALIHEHSGSRGPATVPIVHADLYRLGDRSEVYELGLHEHRESSVAFVEWGEQYLDELGHAQLIVRFSLPEAGGDSERHVRLECTTDRWVEIVAEIVSQSLAGVSPLE